MSIATRRLTEAEQERIARARIDRLRQIREEHGRRKGISPHDVTLRPADFDRAEAEARDEETMAAETIASPAPGTRKAKILEAARKLADANNRLDRATFFREIGAAGDPAEVKRSQVAICELRKAGLFPYEFAGGEKKGPKPKPDGAYSALQARINGEAPRPAPKPAPEPEPDGPADHVAGAGNMVFDPARLARLAAELSHLTRDERAFVRAYLAHTDT